MAHVVWILAQLFFAALSSASSGAAAPGVFSRRLRAAQSSFSPLVPEQAVLQRYPYMTHIRSNGSCTAVLIDPMTILTAGHCVEDLEQEEETALVNNRWKQNDFSIAVRANTRQMVLSSGSWSIRHSKFTDPPDWEYVDFDVAIIQLDACVEASSYARLPCGKSRVPPVCKNRPTAWSFGYGRIEGNVKRKELRRAGPFGTGCNCTHADQQPADAAQAYYCLYEKKLDPRGPVEICRGDSGGPVMVEQPQGQPVVVGLNSWGDGNSCGTIRRKNAGYATDLTHPDVNRWLCWFVENPVRRRYVKETCARGGFNRFRLSSPTFRPPSY